MVCFSGNPSGAVNTQWPFAVGAGLVAFHQVERLEYAALIA